VDGAVDEGFGAVHLTLKAKPKCIRDLDEIVLLQIGLPELSEDVGELVAYRQQAGNIGDLFALIIFVVRMGDQDLLAASVNGVVRVALEIHAINAVSAGIADIL